LIIVIVIVWPKARTALDSGTYDFFELNREGAYVPRCATDLATGDHVRGFVVCRTYHQDTRLAGQFVD
jgi:hypothetical protein